MKTTNWKEYLNTLLLAVISYLIVDIHMTFKTMIKDVQDLKVSVSRHEYILEGEKVNRKENQKDISSIFHIDAAIIPDSRVKVKNGGDKGQG